MSPDVVHASILSHGLVGGRWEVRCQCGRSFVRGDRDGAVGAHRDHHALAVAEAAAKAGIPAARRALAGQPILHVVDNQEDA